MATGLLICVVGVLLFYIFFLGYLVQITFPAPHKDVLQPLAVSLVGLLGVGGALLQINENDIRDRDQYRRSRENITSAVNADVSSIMHIIVNLKIPEQFAVRFVDPSADCMWVAAARGEDYLTTYKALAPQFGLLIDGSVGKVVDFYNYFRAARDATAPLSEKNLDYDHVRRVTGNVLMLLSDMFQSGLAIIQSPDPSLTSSAALLAKFAEFEVKYGVDAELADKLKADPLFVSSSKKACP